ncbi:Gfo/Idh/MocA family protein [Pseudooctadecabacter jejudonensis]|uniref:1,5-anhydro-D-fructose reductase n=1 Tax=Pseudooctadecabacter jejudonensis TaxID=1391910 RepID=A0A1Y5S4H0_9RHOB|nr:Gfo/Idh/MocA family oxidoreductase [Pseudooctadecabacter jejudonensis]SLN31077.1 1,5-anhydro-D-fructose reductase [Pseudooctadecabacter jejudonensis]
MKRLKLGMVGGGQGAFIGGVHRIAARLDNRWDLVAGALSSDPVRAQASADDLGLARSYTSYEDMAKAEAARDDGIDAVSIVTPNHMHAGPAIAFLNAGIHVICDKPLAATQDQADDIAHAVENARAKGTHFILTHNYTGYPLIRQARAMVARGDLGQIRVIQAEYAQDWLAQAPDPDNKQAAWRTDPARAGGGAIGDIGTHALNLASFVTGQRPAALAADLHSFVGGRMVDDNAHILLRMDGGARAMLWASQVAVGSENGLRLRIYGDKGGLEWGQENPNQMTFTRFGQPKQILTRGGAGTGPDWTRIPPGHPEGYLEGFATLYADAADLIAGTGDGALLPGIEAAMDGMWFIAACQASSAKDGVFISRGQ